jgi:hypothetical protein
VPVADRAIGIDWESWNDAGENVCRLLFLSGLLELCLDPGLEEISKSGLLACCTSGLVGGRNANELMDNWDIARARETAQGSWPSAPLNACGASPCCDAMAAAGKERCHGVTGDVARNAADVDTPPES